MAALTKFDGYGDDTHQRELHARGNVAADGHSGPPLLHQHLQVAQLAQVAEPATLQGPPALSSIIEQLDQALVAVGLIHGVQRPDVDVEGEVMHTQRAEGLHLVEPRLDQVL